jgi:hypothetical protein
MSERHHMRPKSALSLPYDPVVEVNRFYAEADIEPAYLEFLVGTGFPSRRARRQLGRRRPHSEAR